jgi:3-oxoacyl-[acyl-carrier protein] reductase
MAKYSQIAVITGASSGIGEATACKLAADGWHVVLLARSKSKLLKIKQDMRKQTYQVSVLECDLANDISVNKAIQKISQEIGVVSVLINNAGFGGEFLKLEKLSIDEWDYTFNVNVRAAFLLCRALLPGMRKQKFGRIIHVSSILGITGSSDSSAYIASKHAMVGLSKAIAAEYGEFNITSNAICPGYIDTPMLEGCKFDNAFFNRIPMRRMGTPEEMADFISFLCHQNSHYINGSILVADGGLTATTGINL